jgi:hypothetical protein
MVRMLWRSTRPRPTSATMKNERTPISLVRIDNAPSLVMETPLDAA